MGIKSNIKELTDLKRRAPTQNKAKIDEIINLYSNRQIPIFKTAENLVNRLSVKTNNPTSINKTNKLYESVVGKYKEAPPATGKIERQLKGKIRKTYSATMILFREPDDGDTKTKTMSVNVASSSKKEKQDIIEQAEEDIKQIRKQKTYSKLKQFYLGSFDLRLTGNEYEYLQGQTDKMIHRGSDPNFRRVADMLIDGNVIFANLMSQNGQSYLKAIYIMNLTNSDTRGRAFEPKRVKNRDGEKITCYYRYISTELDLTTNTFKEAIENNNYRSNECFINSIYDTYKDTLFNDNRKQYITRDDILSIIGKTENEVIQGLSIEDMLPFFVKFRLSLRVFIKCSSNMIHQLETITRKPCIA